VKKMVSVVGVHPEELDLVRTLVDLLRHEDPLIPELTRQATNMLGHRNTIALGRKCDLVLFNSTYRHTSAEFCGSLNHMRLRYFPGFLGLVLSFLFFSSVPSTAEQVTNQTEARERALLAQSYATEKLWVWQKRLNLESWNITVQVARTTELKPRTLGNIHWDAEKKKAVIKVLDPADYTMALPEMLADLEFTVVHELIHLELSSLPRSEASRSEEEQAVNQIARALLALDRKQ